MADRDPSPPTPGQRNEPESPLTAKSLPAAVPAAVDASAHPRQPPLSIGHLMLWTAGSAIALTVDLAARWGEDGPAGYRAFANVMQVCYSMTAGIAVSSLVLCGYRRLTKGPAFPIQPGHWLLVVDGIVLLVSWCAWGLFMRSAPLVTEISDDRSLLLFGWRIAAIFGLEGVAHAFAAWRLRDRAYWRLYLLIASLFGLSMSGTCFLISAVSPRSTFELTQGGQRIGDLVLGLALLGLVTFELRRRVSRDWLHWTGVVLRLINPMFTWAFVLWSMLAPWYW